MKKNTLMLLAVATSVSALAGTEPYADHVRLNAVEFSTGGWTGPEHWGDGTGSHPNADTDYIVPADKQLFVPGVTGSNPWNGGQLVVEGTLREGVSSGSLKKPGIADLVFLPGSKLVTSALYGGFASAGVSVLTTRENPLRVDSVYNSKSGVTFKFESTTFAGGSDAGILIDYPSSQYAVTTMFYANNFVNFLGGLMLRSDKTVSLLLPNSKQGTYTFGGAVEVSGGAQLTLVNSDPNWANLNTVAVGDLAVTNGGVLAVRLLNKEIRPVLAASRSLAITNGGVYRIDSTEAYAYTNLSYASTSGGAPYYPENKFKLAALGPSATCALDVGAISFPDDRTGFLPFNRRLVMAETADGTDVYLKFGDIVPTRIDCSSSTSKRSETPFTHEKFWTIWQVPDDGFDGNLLMRHYFHNVGDVAYPLATMVLSPGSSWTLYGGAECRLADLAWMPGAGDISTWSTPHFVFRGGRISLVGAGERRIKVGSNCRVTFESGLTGDGTLRTDNRLANTVGTLDFAGDASAFTGRLVMESLGVDGTYETADFRTTLGAAEQWGGVHLGDGEDWNAVTFVNSPLVSVTNDVAFTEPTRGFYVDGAVRFDVVEGRTLALGNPVAYAGTLKKLGAGTLVLSGPAQFADNGSLVDAPVAGKSALAVLNGGLEVMSKTAVDGLSLTFAEGSRLVVRASSAQGVYDVKSPTPFSSTRADGKIPVEVVGLTRDDGDAEVTLCTVSAAAASSLPADAFRVLRTASGHRAASVEKRDSGDGNVSYVANMKIMGFVLFVR